MEIAAEDESQWMTFLNFNNFNKVVLCQSGADIPYVHDTWYDVTLF